jgi:very-short-patch-repair endonuclease
MDIDQLLGTSGGVATRAVLSGLVGRHRFDNLVKSGQLSAVFPRVYARPWDIDIAAVRRAAAVLSVGGTAAMSHLTALAMADLPVPDGGPLHVTAYQPRHPREVADELVVHRTRVPMDCRQVDGLPTVRLETALATSWPLLAGPQRRAPLIEAYRRRLLSAGRLAKAVESAWWVRDVRTLRQAASQVLAGCESELELWGYIGVFDVPGLRDANRQRVVRIGDTTYRLDMAYDDEMLNVELDGRRFHASAEQWERDIARDLALAKLGWLTIRLPHDRLFGDVEGCRSDVLAVREVRRRRLAS